MNIVVLDTHVLLWWTLDPDKLSPVAERLLNDPGTTEIVVSSISIWEIGIKIKRGKLDIGLDIETYASRIKKIDSLAIMPVTEKIWLANLALDWEHRDPADRTIVATAKVANAQLLTKDESIQGFYDLALW